MKSKIKDLPEGQRQACGEPRLTVAVGEAVLVAKSEGSWAHGFVLGMTTF